MKRVLPITVIASLFISSLLAEPTATTAGIATAIGKVLLNGIALTNSSVVFDGDRLSTADSAVLVVNRPGSTLRIGPNSQARYRGKVLELLSGTAEVHGDEIVVAGPFTFSPLSQAQFQIRRAAPVSSLLLLNGSIRLSHGKVTHTIAVPGEYALRDDEPIPAVKGPRVKRKTVIGGAAASGAAATAVIIHRWLTDQEKNNSQNCVSGKAPDSCR